MDPRLRGESGPPNHCLGASRFCRFFFELQKSQVGEKRSPQQLTSIPGSQSPRW